MRQQSRHWMLHSASIETEPQMRRMNEHCPCFLFVRSQRALISQIQSASFACLPACVGNGTGLQQTEATRQQSDTAETPPSPAAHSMLPRSCCVADLLDAHWRVFGRNLQPAFYSLDYCVALYATALYKLHCCTFYCLICQYRWTVVACMHSSKQIPVLPLFFLHLNCNAAHVVYIANLTIWLPLHSHWSVLRITLQMTDFHFFLQLDSAVG